MFTIILLSLMSDTLPNLLQKCTEIEYSKMFFVDTKYVGPACTIYKYKPC